MLVRKYEDLVIWQVSMELTKQIYELTRQGEFSKDFPLRDQVRRSVISISSNMVEGFEKNNNNEFIRFLGISKGSIGELRSQLHIAHLIGYIPSEVTEQLDNDLKALGHQVGKLMSYLKEKREKDKNA